MKEFWNERYNQEEYVYGKEPNAFFKYALKKYPVGKEILLPAEGEGRNAVYAAQQGFSVTAFDYSTQAKEKALQFAKENGVNITYKVGEFSEIDLPANHFDTVGLFYSHFPPAVKEEYYKKIGKSVKVGGWIIAELFSKNQLAYREQSGGPGDEAMLFSITELTTYFPNFIPAELEEKLVHLEEGNGHSGMGSVVRFVGRRKD